MASLYGVNTSVDDRIKKIKGDVYQAKDQSAPLPEYDYARKKVTEQANQSNQSAQDALQRRFASMGALNSGSSIKQQQLQNEQSEQQKMSALEGVNVQEAQARRTLMQEEQQKEYQSTEAARGRAFGAEEGQVGRDFQSMEAQKARASQEGMFASDLEFKKWAASLANDTALKQLEVDKFNSAFNAAINRVKEGGRSENFDYYLNNFITQGQERGYYR